MSTPRFALATLTNQANAHIPLNGNSHLLDVLAGLNIYSPLATPPGSPADGDAYWVIATATGAWAGQEGKVAYYNSGWLFITPAIGLRAFWSSAACSYVWMGSAWVPENPIAIALTDSASITIDASLGNVFTVTLGGNRTFVAPTNPQNDGQRILLRIKQDGTGSRTGTFVTTSGGFRFSGGSAVTLTTTANKTDYLEFAYNVSAGKWDCINSKLNF